MRHSPNWCACHGRASLTKCARHTRVECLANSAVGIAHRTISMCRPMSIIGRKAVVTRPALNPLFSPNAPLYPHQLTHRETFTRSPRRTARATWAARRGRACLGGLEIDQKLVLRWRLYQQDAIDVVSREVIGINRARTR